jgi:hypothetical protein
MLLAHRRRALITFSTAAMQLAWFAPFVLLVLPAAATLPVLASYAALLAVVVLWLLLLDALNRLHVPSPRYELAVLGLVLLSTLFFLRLFLYSDGRAATDLSWLGNLLRTLFDFRPGAFQVLAVIVVNIVLWQRATSATGREITFFTAGFSFRSGMLLLIVGSMLLEVLGRADPRPLLWCYFGFGLLAVALARIEDKAEGSNSQGTPLPGARLAQLFLAVVVTIGLAALLSLAYTRESILAAVAWLAPVWRVLDVVLSAVLTVLGWPRSCSCCSCSCVS